MDKNKPMPDAVPGKERPQRQPERSDAPDTPSGERAPEPLDEQALDDVMRKCPL
jgi:hypothetical protein